MKFAQPLSSTGNPGGGLGLAVGEVHRRYTNFINARGRWMGHLFQSRFASVAMDEVHLMAAVCYVSLNPVRARLVGCAADWEWSSVRAHLAGADDRLGRFRNGCRPKRTAFSWFSIKENHSSRSLSGHSNCETALVAVRPVLDRVSCFADLLLEDRDETFAALRRAEGTGRPVGAAEFVTGLERLLGRPIARRAPGPRPAASVSAKQLKLLQQVCCPLISHGLSRRFAHAFDSHWITLAQNTKLHAALAIAIAEGDPNVAAQRLDALIDAVEAFTRGTLDRP